MVRILDKHPVLQDALCKLRDKKTNNQQFRTAAQVVSMFLAIELSKILPAKKIMVETPVGDTICEIIDLDLHRIVLVPILRSGIAMLPEFLKWIPNCDVGFIGQKRDEITAKPTEYYRHIQVNDSSDIAIILDPMIATGKSMTATIQALLDIGIKLERINIASIVAAPEGIELLGNKFPSIDITVAVLDKTLNKQKFITPGLGDFGDRYFGTKNKNEVI